MLAAATASANTMHLSTNGTGQVLLFPYYTARDGNASLMSLVNTTLQAKAVRVNVREARGGFVVAQFNVYLSAKDVWTAAIVSDGDGAQIVTSDTSCTAPSLRSGLAFSNNAYRGDSIEQSSRDRTREGYVEVIEMASIPNSTPMGIGVTHNNGVPRCRRVVVDGGVDVTSAAFEPPAADLIAPSGGLIASLSFVNVGKGMLASAPPTVIESFWLTGPGAPAPRVVPANSSTIDLTSGKNTTIAFSGVPNPMLPVGTASQSVASPEAARFTARFATSLDAVSGLLASSFVSSEYAFTQDNVLSTLVMMTMPTKPYYIHSDPLAPALGPFSAAWDKTLAKACEYMSSSSFSREEYLSADGAGDVSSGFRPPSQCFVVNPLVSVPVYDSPYAPTLEDPTFFKSPNTLGFSAVQDQGFVVAAPGKEGGWAQFSSGSARARLQPIEAFVHRRDATGTLVWQPVSATLVGLPVIGFTLSQAAYRTGSPQQNYADAVPLRSQTNVITVP
jgi:hypothetical protein